MSVHDHVHDPGLRGAVVEARLLDAAVGRHLLAAPVHVVRVPLEPGHPRVPGSGLPQPVCKMMSRCDRWAWPSGLGERRGSRSGGLRSAATGGSGVCEPHAIARAAHGPCHARARTTPGGASVRRMGTARGAAARRGCVRRGILRRRARVRTERVLRCVGAGGRVETDALKRASTLCSAFWSHVPIRTPPACLNDARFGWS
mmetsp:Transcript_15530/g.42947  ORF Transcript_15530/g.42947 Transcript_15530/m.42947 type:complete len:201 (-) Transcript_15530:81-683(-)